MAIYVKIKKYFISLLYVNEENKKKVFSKIHEIITTLQRESIAIVSEKKKKSTQSAPKLYDLTTLQHLPMLHP